MQRYLETIDPTSQAFTQPFTQSFSSPEQPRMQLQTQIPRMQRPVYNQSQFNQNNQNYQNYQPYQPTQSLNHLSGQIPQYVPNTLPNILPNQQMLAPSENPFFFQPSQPEHHSQQPMANQWNLY
jgi:hypothetical protein